MAEHNVIHPMGLTCDLVQCDSLSLQSLFAQYQPVQRTRRGARAGIAVEKALAGVEDA